MYTKEEILIESIRNDAFELVQKFRERLYDITSNEMYNLLPEFEEKLKSKIRRAIEITDVDWTEPISGK